MAKKIRRVTFLVIIAIIVGMFIAIRIVNGQTVKPVSSVTMVSNSSSSILVKWDKVKNCNGYYLYNYDSSDKYQKLAKVEGEDTCSYEFDDLNGATIYNLQVKAYRIFLGKEYVSHEAKDVLVYSKPEPLEISAFSGGKGVLSVEWDENKNIAGYDICYSLNKDFADAYEKSIDNNSTRNISVNNLNPGDKYYVKGRSYIEVDDQKVYGKWGETCYVVINEKDLQIGDTNPNKPMVALSFDDGPAYTYEGENTTSRILDVLEKYNAKATFFMVGERVDSDTKELLQRELEIGCELGNHTYRHNHYGDDVLASDISKASERIYEYSGSYPTIFRSPGGKLTSTIKKECKKEGLPLAYWSVDTEDWKSKNAKLIYKKVINKVYDGAIILMHDIYPTTADAVEQIVPELINKGYQIVTVSEMIAAKTDDNPKAGQQYVDSKTINNNTK